MDPNQNFNFSSLEEFKKKLKTYLRTKGLVAQFKKSWIDSVRRVVQALNLKNDNDVEQLEFMMWHSNKKPMIELLNDGTLKFDIDDFCEKILINTPEIGPIRVHSMTPINSMSAEFTGSLDHYSCLKFIGQFTKNQQIYDKCVDTLQEMPKLRGLLMQPVDVLVMYQFNGNVDTSRNVGNIPTPHMDKLHDYWNSTYSPPPSTEKQYNRYKREINTACYTNALTGGLIELIVLLNQMFGQHWRMCRNSKELKLLANSNMSDEMFNELEKLLIEISTMELHEKDPMVSAQKKITRNLRLLTKDDEQAINDIFIDAFVYVKDNKYENEIYKRDMLIAVYQQKLVDPNSKLSHNLMRNACASGVLWIVKFLISQGCPTKNLPAYGAWKWSSDSLQLSDILKEPKHDTILSFLTENGRL